MKSEEKARQEARWLDDVAPPRRGWEATRIPPTPMRERVIACMGRHPEWTELFLPTEDFVALRAEVSPLYSLTNPPVTEPLTFYGGSRSGRTLTIRAYHGVQVCPL